jgi:hypothetical protein
VVGRPVVPFGAVGRDVVEVPVLAAQNMIVEKQPDSTNPAFS